jgi:hypothetical protein
MRYFLLSLAAFLLLAIPAFAANDHCDVTVTIDNQCYFDVTTGSLDFAGGTWDATTGWSFTAQDMNYNWWANYNATFTATWAPGTWNAGLTLSIVPGYENLGPGSGSSALSVDVSGTADVPAGNYDGIITMTQS